MNPHLFLAFRLAATALALLPGPVVTLVVANSFSQGTRNGLVTVAGAGPGNALLIDGALRATARPPRRLDARAGVRYRPGGRGPFAGVTRAITPNAG